MLWDSQILSFFFFFQGQKLYPARGKNSEQPMKTCFLRSTYIRCLLHLQKKEKSWIWAWSPRIFSLGTHQKWVNEYWPHLRARSWELKTVERLRLLSWEPSLESEQTPTLSRMVRGKFQSIDPGIFGQVSKIAWSLAPVLKIISSFWDINHTF